MTLEEAVRTCGVQTPRMKAPCALWYRHTEHAWSAKHQGPRSENEDTPKLRQFRHIVETALKHGVQLSYLEIGELMDHKNLRSVANYGLGSRFTKLRQKMYEERGIKVDNHRRTQEQSAKIVEDMRRVL